MSRRATRAGGAWSAQFGRIRLPWQPPVAAFHYLDPPMSPLLVLIVAVLATTYAGPIVRLAAAPAVAIAFWRLVLVLPVTFGVATRERQPTRAVREAFPLMLLSGLLLATHFWTWIASLKFTSVASSVLLVSLKPVFAWAVAALWLGEHPGGTERRGIA